MVYFRNTYTSPASLPFTTRLLENSGFGVVSSLANLSSNSFNIRTPDGTSWVKNAVSIIICTYDRPESLNETLQSLTLQIFKNFEVILVTEKGDLSALRDKGLKAAIGDIACFLDDDVYCPATWLQAVFDAFKKEGVVGVTGPTIIVREYKKNRDCFKYERLRKIQEWLFKVPTAPSKLSVCGAPSMVSNDEGCSYGGEVQYLECCNMAVKRKEAIDVGGFDHHFCRTSEWCEIDLAFKLGQKGKLWFAKECALFHRPSQAGVYKARLETIHRWDNFMYFQKKWIKPSFRTYCYRGFVWSYLKMKELRII